MQSVRMENKLTPVLYFTDDDVKKIRKYYNVNEDLIEKNVEILQNWIKQQRHLPQNQDSYFLERLLLRNKFRIEETKKKLENYFTLRGIHKEFLRTDNELFIPSKEVSILVPCPKLTHKQERVFYATLRNPDPNVYDLCRTFSFYFTILELMMRNDYAIGDRLICDLGAVTLDHLKKIYPHLLLKALNFYQGVLSSRLISLDLVNAPSYVSIFLNMLKIAFPPKLYNRVTVHPNFNSLAESYTKAYLPKDFDGDLPSINSLNEQWEAVMKEQYRFLNDNYYNVSNESLRVGDTPKNELYGIDGTFRKINLD